MNDQTESKCPLLMRILRFPLTRLLLLGLATWFAVPVAAVAENLPDCNSAAGMLKIGKEPERPDAEIFHMAYTLKGADPAKRPVTFVFNGGPGAASICLHIAAIGPKTLVTAGDGSFPSSLGLLVAGCGPQGVSVPSIFNSLRPQAYTWYPERSVAGPVLVFVSIPRQEAVVYRNGIRIGRAAVSTGRPGHSTPTGVFQILQKDVDHHSKTYNNAPMPYLAVNSIFLQP